MQETIYITPQQCHRPTASLPYHIEAAIHAEVAPTKYWVHKLTYFPKCCYFSIINPFLFVWYNIVVRDIPIRSVGSGSGRSGHFSADWNQQFWTWTQARFFIYLFIFFNVRAQFVAERIHARNVTWANLWLKCLQCGNNLKLESKSSPMATYNICYTYWSCI